MGDKSLLLFSHTVCSVFKKGPVQAFKMIFFSGSARSEFCRLGWNRQLNLLGKILKMPVCRASMCGGVMVHSAGLELVVQERAASSEKKNPTKSRAGGTGSIF